ncbi:MAG: hypothetical protein HYY63_02440, partial [Elusimicrobia bacterium]|nr:hypothetical protein [Elusimicrobiota bacterium]
FSEKADTNGHAREFVKILAETSAWSSYLHQIQGQFGDYELPLSPDTPSCLVLAPGSEFLYFMASLKKNVQYQLVDSSWYVKFHLEALAKLFGWENMTVQKMDIADLSYSPPKRFGTIHAKNLANFFPMREDWWTRAASWVETGGQIVLQNNPNAPSRILNLKMLIPLFDLLIGLGWRFSGRAGMDSTDVRNVSYDTVTFTKPDSVPGNGNSPSARSDLEEYIRKLSAQSSEFALEFQRLAVGTDVLPQSHEILDSMSLYDAPSWWKKYVSKDKKVWDSYGAPFFESLVLGLWVSGLAAITTLGVLTMIGLFVGQPQGFVAVGTVLFLVSLKLYGALLADRRFTQMHQEKGLNVGRAPPIVDGVSFGFAWYAARSSLPILSSNEFLSPILALLFVMAIATVVYTAIHISGHYGYSDVVVPWINSRIPDLNLSPMSLSSSPNLPPYILQSISNVFDSGGYPDFKRLWIDPQWNEDQKREFALMVEIRFGRWVLEQSDPEVAQALVPILREEKDGLMHLLGVDLSEIQELAKPQITPSVPPPPAFQEEPDIPKPKT